MAQSYSRKRSYDDENIKSRIRRPKKKSKKAVEYHSDSAADEAASNPDFQPINLLGSDDEDLDNVAVDDVSLHSGSDSESKSDSEAEAEAKSKSINAHKVGKRPKSQATTKDAPSNSGLKNSEVGSEEEDYERDSEDEYASLDGDPSAARTRTPKSKRNDPDAFATSMSKILSTKLSTTRRADPVLSRSVEAHQAARELADTGLEQKARKQMREQKRAALEKGRVKDVLVGTRDDATGELDTLTTGDIINHERKLRKVAHRGVVMLFRAVREAQERAVEAEKGARKEGIVGPGRREERVNEMSRQGFLDLIAGGGGKLKKGALEEA